MDFDWGQAKEFGLGAFAYMCVVLSMFVAILFVLSFVLWEWPNLSKIDVFFIMRVMLIVSAIASCIGGLHTG